MIKSGEREGGGFEREDHKIIHEQEAEGWGQSHHKLQM